MKEFIKQKYNILIPIFLVVVILIALILYGREYKNNRYAETKEEEVYQYFSGTKLEYNASISRNRKKVILNYNTSSARINLDSTPVYLKNKGSVMFPKEMMIFFPLKNVAYQVNSLAEIYKENDLYYLNQKDLNKTLDHTFYYDGKDLYFFTDTVTIEVGDKNIILSPMSYLNCSYQNLLEYYDKDSDTYEKIPLENEKVLVKNNYMTIDVTLDKVIYKDSFTLLTSDFISLDKITTIDE